MLRIEACRKFSGDKVDWVTLRYYSDHQTGELTLVATERVQPEDFADIAAGLRDNGASVEFVWTVRT